MIGPHLSALKLETYRLYNLVMHMPCSFFELRHFILVLQYNFKKPLTLTLTIKRGLQSVIKNYSLCSDSIIYANCIDYESTDTMESQGMMMMMMMMSF